jgi:c-di-GMP-binding flagellar brake protein YcgR
MEIRRRDKRFKEKNEVIIRYTSDRRRFNNYLEINASTFDLSISGARIHSKKSFPIGTVLRIQIDLKKSNQVIKVDGKIIWVEKMSSEDLYEIGVEFLHDISKTVLSLLRHLYGEDKGIPSTVS